MACGCKKNAAAPKAAPVVKSNPVIQESKPEKKITTNRIIKREIR